MIDAIHQRIAEALARIGALTRAHEQHEAAAETLSALQARVLHALRRRSGLRVGELAQELMVTYGTVSAAISSLEGKGLVRKSSDPQEHRAVVVELTRRGSAAARRAEGWGGELLEPAVAELRAPEAATLLASLLKLIEAFERQGLIAKTRMCLSCQYFQPGAGSGSRPHYCALLEQAIGAQDLRVDCSDHVPAGAAQRQQAWKEFSPKP